MSSFDNSTWKSNNIMFKLFKKMDITNLSPPTNDNDHLHFSFPQRQKHNNVQPLNTNMSLHTLNDSHEDYQDYFNQSLYNINSSEDSLKLFNISVDNHLGGLSEKNHSDEKEIVIIIIFTTLILLATFGNTMVCLVVARNPKMRTPRNLFIVNLAICDLSLCLVTQPMNLVRLLRMSWPLGAMMCKVVPACSVTNFYVSTISITAIALDRFKVSLRDGWIWENFIKIRVGA